MEIKEKFMSLFTMVTYLFTGAGILGNTEAIQKTILFVGGLILLTLQIYLHLIKIKKERKGIKEKKDDQE